MRICIYAASSAHCDSAYHADARALGATLARAGHVLVYGGGAVGSMGALADGALEAGGEVVGVIPRFMVEREWAWPGKGDATQGVSANATMDGARDHWRKPPGVGPRPEGGFTLQFVEDMRERKHRLLTGSDAVVALPGGCGTLEELFEAITLKQLGIYHQPIVLLNTRGYWTPWATFMQRQVIDECFMNPGHGAMWQMVDAVDAVLPAIATAPAWGKDAIEDAPARPR
ncbi:MAG: LOG family protein [Proteobacteria bacterium]|nr:LOG family protein [Pseudomonadota bacterium]